MIEDYTYVGIEFHGDPDLDLPKGEHWGKLSKKDTMMHVFTFFMIFMFDIETSFPIVEMPE